MKLGKAIRLLRTRRGLTQMSFAKKIGITNSFLSRMENDLKRPSLDVLEKMAEATDTPLFLLFFWAADEKESKKAMEILKEVFSQMCLEKNLNY